MKVLRFATTQKDGTSAKVGAPSGDCAVCTHRVLVSVCVCVGPPVHVHIYTGWAQVRGPVMGVAHILTWYVTPQCGLC